MSIYGYNLHLPYTCLVTKLRMSKRQSEIEMADILKEIINLKNTSQTKTKEQVVDLLRKSKAKLETLKCKLREQKIQQDQIYDICRKRVHLDKQTDNKSDKFTKQQMLSEFDKQVIQFFACRNKIKEARSIQNSLKCQNQYKIYVDLYQKAYIISEAIIKNDLRPLKDWCYEHSHYLSKIKSSLQFKLISCGFINILNHTTGAKAIQFLRKQVATLSLSDADKQELNKLTFVVLLSENQSDFQYYSDSEKEKAIQKQLKSLSIKKLEIKKDEQKKSQNDGEANHDQHSSSSSSNVNEALIATQQNMRSIFRAVGELALGAQGLISMVSKTRRRSAENEQKPKIPQQSLEPQEIEDPEPKRDIEQENYEDEWEELSQQIQEQIQKEEDRSIKQFIKQAENNIRKSIQLKRKGNDEKKLSKQKTNGKTIMKEIKRKHKLDKNNLRGLLTQTRQQFLSTFSKIYQLSFQTMFDKTLAIGISIIKTSHCSQTLNNSKISGQHGYCPTCTKQVQKIMHRIPATLKHQSSLICRINGTLMNEMNHPIVLPNGQIYSLKGLQQTQKHGKYYCLAQNKWFRKDECRKVFLT